MAYVNIAIAGVSAFNAIQQGHTASAMAGQQAQLDNYQAQVANENALETASIIRRAGRRLVSAQTAGYAGAGVKVGEGSALEVERQTDFDYEHDAYQAILEGRRRGRAMQLQGAMGQAQGDAQEAASYATAAGSVLGGMYGGLRASGWRTGGAPGYSGTQSPAPVVNHDIPRD